MHYERRRQQQKQGLLRQQRRPRLSNSGAKNAKSNNHHNNETPTATTTTKATTLAQALYYIRRLKYEDTTRRVSYHICLADKNEAVITEKYGARWFRMWTIFLGWSVIIAAQGSSTVFMVTLAKNTKNDKASVSSDEAAAQPYSRIARWIGQRPVATQQ